MANCVHANGITGSRSRLTHNAVCVGCVDGWVKRCMWLCSCVCVGLAATHGCCQGNWDLDRRPLTSLVGAKRSPQQLLINLLLSPFSTHIYLSLHPSLHTSLSCRRHPVASLLHCVLQPPRASLLTLPAAWTSPATTASSGTSHPSPCQQSRCDPAAPPAAAEAAAAAVVAEAAAMAARAEKQLPGGEGGGGVGCCQVGLMLSD